MPCVPKYKPSEWSHASGVKAFSTCQTGAHQRQSHLASKPIASHRTHINTNTAFSFSVSFMFSVSSWSTFNFIWQTCAVKCMGNTVSRQTHVKENTLQSNYKHTYFVHFICTLLLSAGQGEEDGQLALVTVDKTALCAVCIETCAMKGHAKKEVSHCTFSALSSGQQQQND